MTKRKPQQPKSTEPRELIEARERAATLATCLTEIRTFRRSLFAVGDAMQGSQAQKLLDKALQHTGALILAIDELKQCAERDVHSYEWKHRQPDMLDNDDDQDAGA